jgi:RNA polymerase sigma-70 factor (ECF subfamily)
MSDRVSQELLARVEGGDEDAAQALYDRYVHRLIGLARKRLSGKLARRVDPEDIVQSAYRSFFAHAADGCFEISKSGDLWRLLAAITLNKLRSKAKFHRRRKRDLRQEDSMSDRHSTHGIAPVRLACDPTPDEATALAEYIERLMAELTPLERKMLELRLQLYTLDEIAEQVDRSERTVRRLMRRLRERLERELANELPAA